MAVAAEGFPHNPDPTSVPPKIDGSFKGQDILSFDQLDPNSLEHLFSFVPEMKKIAVNAESSHILDGTISYLLFYEPSSRTRGSFEAALKQLHGEAVVEGDPLHYSSVAKGESFEDTIRTYEAYSDMIILRHPEVGAAKRAAAAADYVPIINAGDGIGEHPTQALLDLYTIKEHTGRLDNLSVVAGGDILNGRTIHSLLKGLAMYPGNRVHLLAPETLRLGSEEVQGFREKGLEIVEINGMDEIPKTADIWYWTRVQRERMMHLNEEEYIDLRDKFIVTPGVMEQYAGEHTGIMHPLPRVGEIEPSVDKDSRALYLRNQVRNGMYVRMALSSLVLGKVS
jgi:aspartate carbamoyltransferase